MPYSLVALCLVTLVLCNIHGSLEHEIPRRSFLSRRAIDGTRGRKYFDPEEEGAFDSYGSAGGQYDPFEERTDFSDIRRNVPGEPGVDYPAYTRLPQTGFTCEGRSRGYYADVVAGCQVFHVCHDVLVSSFLCPVGSIFSQKLLTCDWWTKVDCPASEKYIDVNRNSYQQDDDEMIRNAYAMVTLQSGTDLTQDGLVDPDRTGSIVDYQRGPGRVLEFPRVNNVGNDLKNNFDDFANTAVRNFLPTYNQFKDRKPETGRSYQERLPPFQNSPIIRVQKINDQQNRNKEFLDVFPKINEFERFQPSYAPTVPTVTTTTRRYYSPTVPIPFKPSTPSYNKLDQLIDGSDFFFSKSRSNSFVTPPTIFSPGGNVLRSLEQAVEKAEDQRMPHRENYEGSYENVEATTRRPENKFQVRVPEFQFNRTDLGSLLDAYRDYEEKKEEEFIDDIETRGSIGLGHALREISVLSQNPIKERIKEIVEAGKVLEPKIFNFFNRGEVDHSREGTTTTSRPNIFQDFFNHRQEEIGSHREGIETVTTPGPNIFEEIFNHHQGETRSNGGDTADITTTSRPNIFQDFFNHRQGETGSHTESATETVTTPGPNIFQDFFNHRQGETGSHTESATETVTTPKPNIIQDFFNHRQGETRSHTESTTETVTTPGPNIFQDFFNHRQGETGSHTESATETVTTPTPNIFQEFFNHRQGETKSHREGVTETATTPGPKIFQEFFNHRQEETKSHRENTAEPVVTSGPNIFQESFNHHEEQTRGPAKEKSSEGQSESVTSGPNVSQYISNSHEGETESWPDPTIAFEERKYETTEHYQRNNQRHREGFSPATRLIEESKPELDISVPSTTPSAVESTIKATTRKEPFNLVGDSKKHATAASETLTEKESIDRVDTGAHTFRPIEHLRPPQEGRTKFQIKVPDLSEVSSLLIRYSTLADGPYPGTGTTEMPRFQSIYPDYVDQTTLVDEIERVTEKDTSKGLSSHRYPTTVARPLTVPTGPRQSTYEHARHIFPILNREFHFGFGDPADPPRDPPRDPPGDPPGDPPRDPAKDSCTDESEHCKLSTLASRAYSSLGSSGSTLTIDAAEEKPRSNKETTTLSTFKKPVNIESSESTSKTVTHRSIENTSKLLKDVESKGVPVEASTASSILKSIRPETLKHIEETIEKTNSPYQVTLTVAKDDELVSEDDLITKLLTQQGKEATTLSDKTHHLEIVKSVEPEIQTHSTDKIFETSHHTKEPKNSTTVEEIRQSFSTVSLHQLMTELLKLDRAPRPFSRSVPQTTDPTILLHDVTSTTQSVRAKTAVKDTSFSMKLEERSTTKALETSTASRTSTPLKKQILGQLTETFGEPLYRTDRYSTLDPPEEDRTLNFRTGRPVNKIKTEEPSTVRSTLSTTTRAASTAATTTTVAPKTTLTTESTKTIVETEFVPSIGFSLDTDEGREEYVEAVLGGLTDSVPAGTEKKETTASKVQTLKNETLKTG